MAYSGRMVRAGAEHTPCLYRAGAKKEIEIPPSRWYNVPAEPDETHKDKWRAEEGRELYARLMDLIEGGIAPEQILVIAPFKIGANKVRDIFRTTLKQTGRYSDNQAAELAASQAGTVHTSQGREADTVFLVMGSAPGKPGCGSRDWVNASPNMLNVAVSRAKRRLYVIGNVLDWESGKYSEQLIRSLPIYNPSEPR
jgi:superfamily I DNA and/or RNA helicase